MTVPFWGLQGFCRRGATCRSAGWWPGRAAFLESTMGATFPFTESVGGGKGKAWDHPSPGINVKEGICSSVEHIQMLAGQLGQREVGTSQLSVEGLG